MAPEESVKFKLRKAKLRQLEREQELEDAAHLGMSAEEHAVLHATFADVHVEFEDLDGLSWHSDAAQDILREWKRKKFFEIISTGRQRQGLPLLRAPSMRSSSRSRSSSGFTMPALARTRPSIPVALLNAPRTLGRAAALPMPGLMTREGSRTQYGDGDEEDDWLDREEPDDMDGRLSRAIRDLGGEDNESLPARDCPTLGRSWRGGAKTRHAIPPLFSLVSSNRGKRSPSPLQKYFESGGQDLDPLDNAFAETDPHRSADEGSRGTIRRGSAGAADPEDDWATFPDDDGADERRSTTEQLTVATRSTDAHHAPAPPPILAGSPRLGNSAGVVWGLHCGAGSPTLGSSRFSRDRVRNGGAGHDVLCTKACNDHIFKASSLYQQRGANEGARFNVMEGYTKGCKCA